LIHNYLAQNPATWNKDRFNEKKDPDTESANYPDN